MDAFLKKGPKKPAAKPAKRETSKDTPQEMFNLSIKTNKSPSKAAKAVEKVDGRPNSNSNLPDSDEVDMEVDGVSSKSKYQPWVEK